MSKENPDTQSLPFIVFIPIIICVIGILFLLYIQQRRNKLQIPPQELINGYDTQEEFPEVDEDEEVDDNYGEGSSTAVRVKRVGKKRGEKLKRKEQMRQYREYMTQQQEIRRAQNEIYEQEFKQKKLEETIRRIDDMERRKKEKEKKLKQEKKEELKRQKNEEKEQKKKQERFEKYKDKIKRLVKEKKLCTINELSKQIGILEEEIMNILKKLCIEDIEFQYSLWSGTDTFLFITKEDYVQLSESFEQKGKISIYEGKFTN